MEPATVAQALARAEDRLRAAGVPTPDVDARLLLGQVLGLRPNACVLHRDRELAPAEAAAFARLVAAREARRPLQLILGAVEFYGRSFRIAPGVLIPRFETECVIEVALGALGSGAHPRLVADVGTGSGVIGLTLACERPEIAVVLTDRSRRALVLAAENARHLAVVDRVRLLSGDLARAFAPGSLDVLVANPPYIPTAAIAGLAPEVRDHDPWLALDGGADGLAAIGALVADAPRVLRPGGHLVLEIGDDQGPAARELAAAQGLAAVGVHADLSGRDRVLSARRG